MNLTEPLCQLNLFGRIQGTETSHGHPPLNGGAARPLAGRRRRPRKENQAMSSNPKIGAEQLTVGQEHELVVVENWFEEFRGP